MNWIIFLECFSQFKNKAIVPLGTQPRERNPLLGYPQSGIFLRVKKDTFFAKEFDHNRCLCPEHLVQVKQMQNEEDMDAVMDEIQNILTNSRIDAASPQSKKAAFSDYGYHDKRESYINWSDDRVRLLFALVEEFKYDWDRIADEFPIKVSANIVKCKYYFELRKRRQSEDI